MDINCQHNAYLEISTIGIKLEKYQKHNKQILEHKRLKPI